MYFQISKLGVWVHNCVRSLIIFIVLWLQDLYIAGSGYLSYCWLKLIILGCILSRWFDKKLREYNGRTRLLRAVMHSTGADVTIPLTYFYMCDKLQSCASLYRWLEKFGHRGGLINIVFMRGDVLYAGRFDLDNDRELLTNQELPDGDVDLAKLIGKKLFHTTKESRREQCSMNAGILEKLLEQLKTDVDVKSNLHWKEIIEQSVENAS